METNKLNDVVIKNAKPKPATYILADGEGMYLEVTPKGGKWWRLKYRFGGKQKRLSLGTYPETRLKEARAKRQEARDLLAQGIDPARERKTRKQADKTARRNTFAGVAEEWADNKIQSEKWTATTEKKRKGWLEKGLIAHLGDQPVSEIPLCQDSCRAYFFTNVKSEGRQERESCRVTARALRSELCR
ncbi:tyrosine-type recombinase/integrase [Marinobacter sp. NSM]|uniref:tyrosine-type recombinase/integrase n=1 Tax=Marinobacter sp. NSM TaxID=3458004 RepID=UPI004035E0CE